MPALHPFGQADPRALLYQTYQLDLTDALITQVYGSKLTPAILAEGYYATPAGETGHWIASDVATFEPAQFYLPTSFTDPFGAVTSVQYDAHRIFPTEITDDLGNTTSAEHDYAALQPAEITDPNGNRTQAQYNPLGLLTAVAVMGKIGNSDGDTLADPTIKLSYDLTPRQRHTAIRQDRSPRKTRPHQHPLAHHHRLHHRRRRPRHDQGPMRARRRPPARRQRRSHPPHPASPLRPPLDRHRPHRPQQQRRSSQTIRALLLEHPPLRDRARAHRHRRHPGDHL
ncbi:MAG: hypothetical protein IPG04_40310 [Polyangiaceae bacterium]|nr:hypothetical protein [Polyangiaceae bacterium]